MFPVYQPWDGGRSGRIFRNPPSSISRHESETKPGTSKNQSKVDWTHKERERITQGVKNVFFSTNISLCLICIHCLLKWAWTICKYHTVVTFIDYKFCNYCFTYFWHATYSQWKSSSYSSFLLLFWLISMSIKSLFNLTGILESCLIDLFCILKYSLHIHLCRPNKLKLTWSQDEYKILQI